MCGLCGFTGELVNREEILRKMSDAIIHRGPDSEGYYIDQGISMGFRRLSIIDLEHGHQPLQNEDGTLVLTFNGEIYNYHSLRQELLQAGHLFKTDSDGEVLVHGFEQWGCDLLPRLRGMFAFAVWNKKTRSLFLARDPFGIKPLYYFQSDNGHFMYASEIKCFLQHPGFCKEINEQMLDDYLSFQYALPKQTFFKNVYCLMPAHFLTLDSCGNLQEQRYWDSLLSPDESITCEQAVDWIDACFADSVEAHRIADVEVGCFLSGGVDSSYVASYFKGQKTFSVGFDHGTHYNETHHAAALAEHLHTDHYTKLIDKQEYWDVFPQIQYALDQPLADPSCVALYFVSQLAAEHVKVVLSGEGADELFGGYRIYNEPFSLARYQKLPAVLRQAIAKAVNALPLNFKGKSFLTRGSKPLQQRFIGNAAIFTQKEKERLLAHLPATEPYDKLSDLYQKCSQWDDVTQMQYVDINSWMVGDILLKADRMSMIHSLELRVPFLDREVFSVAARIPTKWRVAEGTTKYALRLAAKRHLPDESTVRPKLGFPVPIRIWLREEDCYNKVKESFESPAAARFFRTEELLRLLRAHYKGKRDNSRKIWTVYSFLVWYQQYFPEKDV